ncbi:hypothetical protein [Actinokineospora cianjurensis]|uniref:Uncharacterized protein n=1 Tax=Actinokineospora cianjurensis TaxID=585224 RepID=A0A421B281_9PSEU|nr:hypothetical protein [Actinokineospora cianjurensis]RLK58448.1 hypothetical protein CLV68_4552 [Actinokineospora cianjurensis]
MPLSAFAVTDPDESFVDLVGFVHGQATPADLESLDKARKQRIDVLADGLEVGDSVMLANIQRKYLAGLTGTVKTVDHAKRRFSLLLDEASTDRLRYHGRNNRIDIPLGVKEHLLRRSPSPARSSRTSADHHTALAGGPPARRCRVPVSLARLGDSDAHRGATSPPAHQPLPTCTGRNRRLRMAPRLRRRGRADRRRPRRSRDQRKPSTR